MPVEKTRESENVACRSRENNCLTFLIIGAGIGKSQNKLLFEIKNKINKMPF